MNSSSINARVTATRDLTAALVERAADIMAHKLSDAISPIFANIERRLERIERRLSLEGGQVSGQASSSLEQCSTEGCVRQARARGLCSAHYQRLRYQEKKLDAMIADGASAGGGAAIKRCEIDECERPVKARGLCSAHYQRLLYRERKDTEEPQKG